MKFLFNFKFLGLYWLLDKRFFILGVVMKTKSLVKIIVVIIVLVGILGYFKLSNGNENHYVTEKLRIGRIVEKITASGIINPISTVNIGTQVSGTIQEIYVDYNSNVREGQLLAQIDPALFEATVAQRKAALDIAKAQVEVSKNDITYYKKHLDRIRQLNKSKYSADRELETAQRDYSNAVVQLGLQEAQVKQAEASLNSAEIDLKYTRIISPVDGIVVSKEVEVGQTVAASFQTPTLFYVAEDLTKMQIEASIVEADIAKVDVGQKVEFSVDSYPDEIFLGKVTQVRNNPITTSNVVTYEVIIEIDNKDHKLKPGMTANVEIITAQRDGVLLASNKALRFYMEDETGQVQRYQDKGIWVLEKGAPKRVVITTGVSDDDNTEIFSEDLDENKQVIIEKLNAKTAKAAMRMRMPR